METQINYLLVPKSKLWPQPWVLYIGKVLQEIQYGISVHLKFQQGSNRSNLEQNKGAALSYHKAKGFLRQEIKL